LNSLRLGGAATLALSLLAAVPLQAQTAHYGAVVTLGSGFSGPTGVAVDGSGNVYVADFGNSEVKEIVAVNGSIPASPTINTLGSGFSEPFTVAVDGSGNVFLTDYGNHAVKEIEAAGNYSTVRSLGHGYGTLFGSAVDKSGDVFVTDYSVGEVKELVALDGIVPADPKILSLGSGFNIPAGLAVDRNGNIFVGDQNNNAVKEILAASGYTTTNTVATGFNTPDGVAVDRDGNVYVANDGGNSVEEVVAVNGVIPASPTILTLGSGFIQPFDVAVDGSGNVYVADKGNNAVKEIQIAAVNFGPVNVGTASASSMAVNFTFETAGTLGSTAVLTQGITGQDFTDAGGDTCTAGTAYSVGQVCTVNVNFTPLAPGTRFGAVELLSETGSLVATGYVQGIGAGPQTTFATTTSGVSLPASMVSVGGGFNWPGGVAVDANTNVFVADSGNNVVKEIVAAGGYATINTLGSGFNYPNGIAVDGAGNVYVADTFNDAVKEIVAAGGYAAVFSLGSGFSNPYDVAVDGSGNVFVADFANNAVKEIVAVDGSIPASPIIRTLASGLEGPDGVAVDGNGNVFVANYNDNTVQEIVAVDGSIPVSPTINTIASGFSGPSNLSVDGIGNVFVSDTNNSLVREIVAAGGYTTVKTLGSGFNGPDAVAVNKNGKVVVADALNNTVELLDFADTPSLSFAATQVGGTSSDSPQAVTVSNDGNAPLTFSFLSVAANFTQEAGSGTPPDCHAASAVAAGESCELAISFTPSAPGTIGGPVVLTDNSLNAAGPSYATQSIQLSGTGTQIPQAINFAQPTSPVYYPVSPITLSATGGASGNPVTFSISSGPGSLSGTNNSVLTVTGAGTIVIAANQAGNTNYAAAPQVTQSIVVDQLAALTTPTPGSSLTNTSVLFKWTAGAGVSAYDLHLSAVAPGGSDLYSSGHITGLSKTVSGLPTNGEMIYVRLYSVINGVMLYNDYTYTAVSLAKLTSPAPGSALTSTSVLFKWTAGAGVSAYDLHLSAVAAGGYDLYSSGHITGLSTTVNGLPTNGETIYARLYSVINGVTLYTDFTYIAK
jgi:DNA-binding beta-propeller fold protein YncE